MNKKGDVTDMVVFLLILFFLAVSIITALLVNDKLLDIVQDSKLNSSATSSIVSAFTIVNQTTTQRAFVMVVGLLIIGVIVSSFLVKVHPAFLFLYVIVLAFSIFVAVFLSNVYYKFTDVSVINEIAIQQPKINFFMENLVMVVVVVGIISMIVVFAKLKGRGVGSSQEWSDI